MIVEFALLDGRHARERVRLEVSAGDMVYIKRLDSEGGVLDGKSMSKEDALVLAAVLRVVAERR